MKNLSADVAVVGGGVAGIAIAYQAARKGLKVVLFNREEFAVGASVRNFGMVWPIGQEPDAGLTLALRSREIWLELSKRAGFWINPSGSLHLAHELDEVDVLHEFLSLYQREFPEAKWLDPAQTLQRSSVVNPEKLRGALWSPTECVINSREAIRRLPIWLGETYQVALRYGHLVREVDYPSVVTATEKWTADQIYICSGADFETLFPEVFRQSGITRCKLQMMKAVTRERDYQIGPSLCGGLTLRHYASFSKCESLTKLDARFDAEQPFFKEHGIHVLLSQNNYGELIIGDSHHYGLTLEPFDHSAIDEAILNYLHGLIELKNFAISERWNGTYPKLKGSLSLVQEVVPGVTVVNGFGGAGMTLSMGTAEEILHSL
ncbi:MAG: TIGR03364 family FAD-dependent oxidoreductase [Cyclobacteriaceae bacterium]